jgi:hypothetical protein
VGLFAPAIYIRLFDPPPRRVLATPDLWRDGHARRRLIGILMLVFEKHPNHAGADLGLKPVCSVTFFHKLHPYLLWSLRKTWGRFRFRECPPFGDYALGPLTVFMTRTI